MIVTSPPPPAFQDTETDVGDSQEVLLARADVQEGIRRLEDLMSGRVKGLTEEQFQAALDKGFVKESDAAFLQREDVQAAIQGVKDIVSGKVRGLTEEEYLLARR